MMNTRKGKKEKKKEVTAQKGTGLDAKCVQRCENWAQMASHSGGEHGGSEQKTRNSQQTLFLLLV